MIVTENDSRLACKPEPHFGFHFLGKNASCGMILKKKKRKIKKKKAENILIK